MSLSGSLKDFNIAEVLQFLSHGHHSGILTVTSNSQPENLNDVPALAKICLRGGRVVYASAGFRNRLGYRLVDKGILSREKTRLLLEKQKLEESRRPIGALLVEEALICPETVRTELSAQVLEIIRTCLAWQNGSFRFEKVDVPLHLAPHLEHELSIDLVLLEVHRLKDEEQAVAAPLACGVQI